MKTLTKTLTTSPTQATATANGNNFRYLSVFGLSGFRNASPVNNSGSIYFGFNSGELAYTLTTGGLTNVILEAGTVDNVSNIWAKAQNTADGIYLLYQ